MALPSPCSEVCRFNRKTDLCAGCLRTTSEIRQWRKLTDHKRHFILADRGRRLSKLNAKIGPANP
ncbi:DUF1289 domain-containing protein [Dyella lipolytica]|uniref:DUF1289 domain-containing protein n=2 Tax=Dyella lipolytica TaxID=1867835 RepID=A0ABW8J0P6_9GAMM|nr:DUF1289 domain-containing protein [Dyella lipolytica]